MNKKHGPQPPVPFPSRDAILEFIRESPGRVGKREIARAFDLRGDQRQELKRLLRELEGEGQVDKGRGRRFAQPGTLPEVTLVIVSGIDVDGEVLARPQNWNEEDGPPPTIYMAPQRHGEQALGVGDRVLARLSRLSDRNYEGKTIRRIAAAPPRVLGIFHARPEGGGRVHPSDKRHRTDLMVAKGDEGGAREGDLVRAEILPAKRLGLRWGKVTECLHGPAAARTASLIALYDHDIPSVFSDEALREAEAMGPATLGEREDLRGLALVTIDGEDARDFDDAVFAEPDPDQDKNPGGWHLVVAIADVAWYVRPGMALDEDAYRRGNSVYFPDRCVPMLPEALSNGWCSLKPDEDRPVLAAHLWIDKVGNLLRHRFLRGLMRSVARLTYAQVQTAVEGGVDELTGPLLEPVVKPLYGAYAALAEARLDRGVLELDVPERQVILDDEGNVARIVTRARYDSHKLIEEFMILANVAAAQALEAHRQPCMYRIHDVPALDKLESLREFLETLGIKFPKGQSVQPATFNRILKKVEGTPYAHQVNEVVLRSQAQAEYAPGNIGHFGLALQRYCHFTSPIRRYPDLLVHRALIAGLGLGEGGLPRHSADFAEAGQHLSGTERRAAAAERDAVARYVAAYLSGRIGATFGGRISGVTRFGLFVTLDEIGGDGLIPIQTLPGNDYWVHDEVRHLLTGRASGIEYRLGDSLQVVLEQADPITGGMILAVAGGDSHAPRKRWGATPSRPQPRRRSR
ncbi:MAG: ribonuclease R [Magnetospirillum sp. WYHS-4]